MLLDGSRLSHWIELLWKNFSDDGDYATLLYPYSLRGSVQLKVSAMVNLNAIN